MSEIAILRDSDYDAFLRAAIRQATQILYLTIFSADLRSEKNKNFEIKALIHTLGQAVHDGVDVRILLSRTSVGQYRKSANEVFYKFASNRQIPCRFGSPIFRNHFHSKLCVIDQKYAVFGSHNISHEAFTENKELSLVSLNQQFIKNQTVEFLQHWRQGEKTR